MNGTAYAPLPGSTAARAIAHLSTLKPGCELASAVLAEALETDSDTLSAALAYAARQGVILGAKKPGSRLMYWSLPTGEPAKDKGAEAAAAEPDDDPPMQRVVAAADARPIELEHPSLAPAEPPPAAEAHARRVRGPDKKPRKAPQPGAGRAAASSEKATEKAAPKPKRARKDPAQPFGPGTPTYPVPSARSTADWQLTLNELARIGERKPMRCAVWNDGALTIEKNGHRTDLTVDESRGMLQMLRVLDSTLGEGAEG